VSLRLNKLWVESWIFIQVWSCAAAIHQGRIEPLVENTSLKLNPTQINTAHSTFFLEQAIALT